MQPLDVDLTDPDVFERGDHHEMFAVLRREDPVHWQPERDGRGFWCLTTHADVQAANRDAATFRSGEGFTLAEVDKAREGGASAFTDLLPAMDAPRHTRFRRIVNRGFTPRMLGLIETHLAHKARVIVDNVIDRGTCDFVTDIAAELPLQAIAELMGVPQDDRRQLFDWSNRMIGIDDPEYRGDPDEGMKTAGEMFVYADGLAHVRADDPRDDIVTTLINAEIEGDHLSDAEFGMFFLLLVVAGNETTRNATAHGMRALMENPDELAKLTADPSQERIAMAVEEVLRWASPVLYFRRTATRDVVVRDKTIRAGEKVALWYMSANRDETVFDDPYRFDVDRWPNDHVAFGGGGPHFCLGANLARMELRLILREIVTRMPDMTIDGPVQALRSNFVGGIKHMPVRWTSSELALAR